MLGLLLFVGGMACRYTLMSFRRARVSAGLRAGFDVRPAVGQELLRAADVRRSARDDVLCGDENSATGGIEHCKFSNAWMPETLGSAVYHDRTLWDYAQWPANAALLFAAPLLFVATRKDRERLEQFKRGRRLRRPELVSMAQFNQRLSKRKWLRLNPPDGMALLSEKRGERSKPRAGDGHRYLRLRAVWPHLHPQRFDTEQLPLSRRTI